MRNDDMTTEESFAIVLDSLAWDDEDVVTLPRIIFDGYADTLPGVSVAQQ